MTETEWFTCADPKPMLEALGGKASDRKCRLFMAACCRRVWHAFDGEDGEGRHNAVEVAERHADGLAGDEELADAWGDLTDGDPTRTWDCCTNLAVASFDEPGDPTAYAAGAVEEAVHTGVLLATGYYADDPGGSPVWEGHPQSKEIGRAEAAALAALLRDIFGNPFGPVSLDLSWLTPDVLSLAGAAYENRTLPAGHLEPARLALLADALEEGGCTNTDVLDHLRSQGPHVRGCWVVDLLLGKE
jgi:hypothetical protein